MHQWNDVMHQDDGHAQCYGRFLAHLPLLSARPSPSLCPPRTALCLPPTVFNACCLQSHLILQLLLASADASEQMHTHWLNEDGSAKQGLSTRDKQQVGPWQSSPGPQPLWHLRSPCATWCGRACVSLCTARICADCHVPPASWQGLVLYANWALAHLRGPVAVGITGACLRAVLVAVSFTMACAMALWRGVCVTALHHPLSCRQQLPSVGGAAWQGCVPLPTARDPAKIVLCPWHCGRAWRPEP